MKHVEPSGTTLTHDAGAQCFRLGDERVALTPKAYALLVALTREPGRLLTKQELLAEVWPGVVVGEAVLKVAVNEVRRALADDAQSPRFVATEHRRGYRFVGAVAGVPSVGGRGPERPALAGRGRALDFLRERLQRAQLGERQVVFVAGEAGIGKTALLDAFLASLPPGLAARVGRGECVETFGAHEPYAPFLEAFRRLAHGPLRAETIATLRRVAPRWLLELPFLASEGERAELARTLHGATRERMVREAGEAIDALAASGPFVLALEDLHWADASTLDLVAALARRGGPAKLLVVATWRPVEAILVGTPVRAVRDSLVAQKRAHDLLLDVLDPDGVAEHLRARFRGVEVTDAVALRVQRACHGHPLFMLHAVEWLAAERRLVARAGRLELDDASLRLDLPESLQQLLNREVERLAGDEVDVLEVASVAGFDFSAATVACGLEREVVPVEAVLERSVKRAQYLRSRGTIEWPNGVVSASYEFRHSLYRSFLYQRVPPARRVQLHRRIGDRGEEVFGARATEIAAPLAVHFEEGRDPVRAVKYLELEARNDMRRCAPADAAAALSRALALLEAYPDADCGTGPIDLLLARGSTRRVAGEMAEAAADFSAAADRAARRGDAALEVRARLLVASALSWIDLPRCMEAVAAARRALRSLADADERTLVFGKLAYWDLLFDGPARERGGLEASAAALSLARSKGDRAAEAEHTVRHAFLLCAAGEVEEAARLARSGAALCQAVDNAFDPMVASFVEVLALRQTPERARFDAVLDDARRHAEQNGHRAFALLFTLLSIWRDLDDGDAARARPAVEQALLDARALAHGLSERLALALAARLAGMQGDAARRAALDAELASLSRERRVLLQWIADVARASPVGLESPAAKKGAGRRHPR